jgi:iron complex transport system ATP-binding protein
VSFSVEEFVMLGRYPHWSRFSTISAEDRHVLREAVELTGMSAFLDRSVSSLSGGERQKVFIAAAIAQDASVVLLDEPTTFLDPRHQAGTCDLLRRLNAERGLTVVMVTHDINLAARYGQRVLALQGGGAAYWGSAAAFLDADRLEILYGIPFEIMRGELGRTWAVSRTSS